MPSRWKIELRDRAFHSQLLRKLRAQYLLARLPRVKNDSSVAAILKRIDALCRLAREERPGRVEALEDEIRRLASLTAGRPVDWGSVVSGWTPERIEKGVLLKPWLGEREKGVVLVSFGYQWMRLAGIRNLEEFAQRYTLITAPSWTPPHGIENAVFFAHYPAERVFSLISNPAEMAILPRLSPKIQAIPLYASNWVDPELGKPVPFAEKDIDLVMVAGFGIYKRHYVLFQALRDLPRGLRVVLIGQPMPGRTAAGLMAEARQYGVADRFELLESLPHREVCRVLARAKTSVVLSRQEGSCVAVTESMLANTPVALFEDAVIGSRGFINERTGRLLRHRDLAEQLRAFIQDAARYAPREWALTNGLDCYGSTRVLNGILKEAALTADEPWTTDIAVHHWGPDPLLLTAQDRERLQPEYEAIRSRYGLTLGAEATAGATA